MGILDRVEGMDSRGEIRVVGIRPNPGSATKRESD